MKLFIIQRNHKNAFQLRLYLDAFKPIGPATWNACRPDSSNDRQHRIHFRPLQSYEKRGQNLGRMDLRRERLRSDYFDHFLPHQLGRHCHYRPEFTILR